LARAKEKHSKQEADTHVEAMSFEFVDAEKVTDRLREWLQACLYAKSSIKEVLHGDIQTLLNFFGGEWIDFDQVVMKENQALLLSMLWKDKREAEATALAKTPTDLLRLFAALTDSDVSLGKTIKFPKFSRKQRRLVLGVLEEAAALAEDLYRYKGLWLQLGRYIHPGEYRKAYPKTAAAFDALREGSIVTYNAQTEKLLLAANAAPVLTHLQKRPGVLARKLHELLRVFPKNTEAVLRTFSDVAEQMTVKNLLVLKSYFASINEVEFRTVINKKGKIKVLPNNAKNALSADTLGALASELDAALHKCVRQLESWEGKGVWIDPTLGQYTVPLAQRAASDGLLTVGRGSRIPIDMDKVLRLFVYWKQASMRTDLDLSVLQFDEKFGYAGHVSYTNLAESGVVHSGDLQSAPHGAAEFIDISLKAVAPKVRYLAVQVYRYSGEEFAAMQCHAGWMIRTKVDASYKSFDIKTVQNKFDLSGTGGYCVPLIVDLEAKEIIVTDLYMGTRNFHNSVEGAYAEVCKASREISRFTESRPTLEGLAQLHQEARGATLVSREEADISFGISECTYNASDVETLLSELL
jgi:stress response protein SCP2